MAVFGSGAIYAVPFSMAVSTAGSVDLLRSPRSVQFSGCSEKLDHRGCDSRRHSGLRTRDRHLQGLDGLEHQRDNHAGADPAVDIASPGRRRIDRDRTIVGTRVDGIGDARASRQLVLRVPELRLPSEPFGLRLAGARRYRQEASRSHVRSRQSDHRRWHGLSARSRAAHEPITSFRDLAGIRRPVERCGLLVVLLSGDKQLCVCFIIPTGWCLRRFS
jgi:hypothetical protein